ncbi:MAG TPA: response regulator transcription factor [Acidobacteriota bacterium]|nr:response regulator transcription factor [Acidobacteriota bacterium]
MAIRILIADRQEMFREALKRLLESEQDFSVVGETDDGDRLTALAASQKPDVLLMDLNLRKRPGIEALREITGNTGVRPLLLMDNPSNGEILQALLSGACGIVRKNVNTQLLFKAIRAVAAGEYWLSHAGISELVQNLRLLSTRVEQQARQQTSSLSVQQMQIVEAIAAGSSNKEIAQDLSLSERTVKYHLTRIFNKFGVSGRMELARFSLKNNLIREA